MTIRHVFVFRHCVRSTEDEVYVAPDAVETDPAAYINAPLPNWQTPPMGCTAVGTDILERTGQYLAQQFLPSFLSTSSGATTTLRVQFVTDSDQRDVDTGLHLAHGMANVTPAFGNSNNYFSSIDGLKNPIYDADLFNPTQPSKWDGGPAVCDEVDSNAWLQVIQQRLNDIPPPGDMDQAASLILSAAGGAGTAGNWTNVAPQDVYAAGTDLYGRLALVKYFAEAAFYAAASGIEFLPNMTNTERMDLLAWNAWARAVKDIGHPHAALYGAVMMDRILRTLADASLDVNANNNYYYYDQVATFFIGHDGDLNHLATIFNLTWTLPSPYHSGPDGVYAPTPPNAGLHFVYDDAKDSLSVSVVAPVYLSPSLESNNNNDLVLNTTGILEERPVVFVDTDDSQVEIQERRTVISGTPDISALDFLRHLGEAHLFQFPAAMECYEKVSVTPAPTMAPTPANSEVKPPPNNEPTPSPVSPPQPSFTIPPKPPTWAPTAPKKAAPPSSKKSAKGNVVGSWFIFLLLAALLFYVIRTVRRRQRGRSGRRLATYTEMGDVGRHDLSLEMT